MPSSFRYLLAVTGLVALLFAAISAWPLFSSWLRSRTTPPPVQPVVIATPAPPQSTGVTTGSSSRSPAIRTQVKPLPATQQNQGQPAAQPPANASNMRSLPNQRYVPGSWTTGDGEDSLGYCYVRETTTLLNRPDGDPLVPVNLNRCPLTVGKGTRLGMIRQEGNWLLVHSTFATTGWVHEQAVTDVRPNEPMLQ
ncbi:MAG: hypothetical protein R3F46_14430 [bacterium]